VIANFPQREGIGGGTFEDLQRSYFFHEGDGVVPRRGKPAVEPEIPN
jgi:hypothetical protein